MCISSRGTLVMYISSRDISCTLCIDISKLSHLGHMVYRRVSNLFDYTLHVLVSWDPKLDRSIPEYHFICLLCIAFISVPCSLHSLSCLHFHCILSCFTSLRFRLIVRFFFVISAHFVSYGIRSDTGGSDR